MQAAARDGVGGAARPEGKRLNEREDFPRPLTTVDVVIFTVRADRLEVLAVRRGTPPFAGGWALPGGFVDIDRDADLEAAARRKLAEKTGVRSPYLEQLASFGDARRDPRGWSVTTVYFALIAPEAARPPPGANVEEVRWFPVAGHAIRERLAFDHARILAAAVERLRSKVEYTALPVYLLPDEFTIADLQRVYEVVLGRALDRSAFRTRILAADFLEPTGGRRGGSNRPARLYRRKRGRDVVFFPRTFYSGAD
jgi:ADP-ribose pyrophosphatase YjhB (NUDIX family)